MRCSMRDIGETFGLAVGEFSTGNKPVLTFLTDHPAYDREHWRVLGERGLYYTDEASLLQRLRRFTPMPEKDWNCYQEFTPGRGWNDSRTCFWTRSLALTRPEVDRLSGRWISRELLADRPWEPHVTACLARSWNGRYRRRYWSESRLPHGGDVGLCGWNRSCLGFRAAAPDLSLARENIAQNGCTNVTALPFAVDAEHRPIALTKVNSIQAEKNLGDIYITGNGTGGQAVPLDAFCLLNIRLIKLDVQGCEVRASKAWRRTPIVAVPF